MMDRAELAITNVVPIGIASTGVDAAGTLVTFVPNVVTAIAKMGRVSVCRTWVGTLLLAPLRLQEGPVQVGVQHGIASGTLPLPERREAEVRTTNFEEAPWTQENGRKSKFAWTVIGIWPPKAEPWTRNTTL